MLQSIGKIAEDTLMDFVLATARKTAPSILWPAKKTCVPASSKAWTSIASTAGEMSAFDGPTYEAHTHPRRDGSMPRYPRHYVRDEHLMPLESRYPQNHFSPCPARASRQPRPPEARLFCGTSLSLNPATIIDRATFTKPGPAFRRASPSPS